MNRPMHVCPHLGLPLDPASHYAEPSDAHKCYSPKQPGNISLDYQQTFCFSSQYGTCSRFVALPKPEAPLGADGTVAQHETESGGTDSSIVPKTKVHRSGSRQGVRLELVLWGLALILAIIAVYSSLVLFAPKNATDAFAVATFVPFRASTRTLTPTDTATPTSLSTETSNSSPASVPTPILLVVPTPPSDGMVLNLVPDADGVGWAASKELAPHWGDRNLHAGTFQSQTYISMLQFNTGNVLPPGSNILFAALEVTGRNASHLSKTGEWQLELLDSGQTQDWLQAPTDDIRNLRAISSIGRPLSASELSAGGVNRFEFSDEQLTLLDQQLKFGRIAFRIKGPTGDQDNLFSWDAGTANLGGLNAPTLYLVAVPAPLTVLANTPTPANVFTAAADVVRATAFARQFGTPTPFGPGVATATPGGGRIEVTPVNTPANLATAEALSAYATAVAITTGTFTPTPKNVVVIFPTATPVFISIDQLLVPATPTRVAGIDYASVPIPSFLIGKILAISNRFGEKFAQLPIVMDPNGSVSGILSSNLYYQAAYARESFSPNRQNRVIVAPGKDNADILQIWIENVKTGERNQVTHLTRGLAYDAAWSPDGSAIVYVSTETGHAEIFVYNISNQTPKQLTVTTERLVYNQRPSWSPDSNQIVFKSNRESSYFQIWAMNADGSSLRNLSENPYDEVDPVWVKP